MTCEPTADQGYILVATVGASLMGVRVHRVRLPAGGVPRPRPPTPRSTRPTRLQLADGIRKAADIVALITSDKDIHIATELIVETVRAVDLAGDTTAMTSTGTATISVSDGQVWLDLPTGTGRSPATTSLPTIGLACWCCLRCG